VADEALARIGTMLEEIGSRFELVVEAVSGFGGRLDKLREEMLGQFAEVGNQIRFLSDQIAENRSGISALRADLGAEMIRLGEMIGRTRVEFREHLSQSESNLRSEIAERAGGAMAAEAGEEAKAAGGGKAVHRKAPETAVPRELLETIRELKREIRASAEATEKKLGGDLKQTNKALDALARKFERFDDRITVQVRDQEQRLKKVEQRRGRA
jgi:hypothetical protein